MQSDRHQDVFTLYKCPTENDTQSNNTQKTKACKVTYKYTLINPNWEMDDKKQPCIYGNRNPFFVFFNGHIEKPATENEFFCDAYK